MFKAIDLPHHYELILANRLSDGMYKLVDLTSYTFENYLAKRDFK